MAFETVALVPGLNTFWELVRFPYIVVSGGGLCAFMFSSSFVFAFFRPLDLWSH